MVAQQIVDLLAGVQFPYASQQFKLRQRSIYKYIIALVI